MGNATRLIVSFCVLLFCLRPVAAQAQAAPDKAQPVALSFLVDNSSSLRPNREVVVSAVKTLIGRLRPTDVAEVIEFSNDIRVRQRFTSNHEDLDKAFERPAMPSGRQVYGAVHARVQELQKLKSKGGCPDCRLALVVFAAGPDISSAIEARQLLATLQRSRDVVIYAIGMSSKGGALDREIESALVEMSRITGGRALFPKSFADVAIAYSVIGDELFGRGDVPPRP